MAATSSAAILSVESDVEDSADGWSTLVSSLGSPMITPSWVRAAASSFPHERPRVLELMDEGVAAVAPLATVRGAFRVVGARQLGEPVDLLWRDDDALNRLVAELARLHAPLLLDRVPSDSPSLPALRAAYRARRAAVLERGAGSTPFIPLDETWREPERRFSARRRSDLRRARRRAEARGEVELDWRVPDESTVASVFEEAVAVEARSWKGRAGTALAFDSRRRVFYRRYAEAAAEEGSLVVCFLRVDGRPIAMQLDIVLADSLWLLKIGYDEEYADCSPGQLLLLEVIRRCAGLELATVEFLGTSAPWTRGWTSRERQMTSIACLPVRPASVLPLGVELARSVRRVCRGRV